jgi:hypothetical protein
MAPAAYVRFGRPVAGDTDVRELADRYLGPEVVEKAAAISGACAVIAPDSRIRDL